MSEEPRPTRGSAATGPHVLRVINRASVLDALRATAGASTLSELMESTGLSRPAVGRAVADLRERNLAVRDALELRGVAGRPAQRVRFNATLGLVAGVSIHPHRVQVLLADLSGNLVEVLTVDTAPSGKAVVSAAARAVRKALSANGSQSSDLWAVGVGTPGVVDTDAGTVRSAPSIPGWAGMDIAELLGRRLGCPVVIDNDVNLAALAEATEGQGRGLGTFAYVHWGRRLGSGLIVDGAPYRGATHAAGELGFIDLHGPRGEHGASVGPATATDGAGAYERHAGLSALTALALEEVEDASLQDELSAAEPEQLLGVIFARADAGSADAERVGGLVVDRLALGLAALVMLWDPGVVIVGGRLSAIGDPLLRRVTRELGSRVFTVPTLLQSDLGSRAVGLGALHLARRVTDQRLRTVLEA